MKRYLFLAPALLLAGLCGAIGCASQTSANGAPASVANADALTARTWSLTSLAETPVSVAVERSRPTLAFDPQQKRASGLAAVNRFSGIYSIEGATLRFGPLLATKMARAAELNELETRYRRALEQTDGWRIEGNSLVLLSGERVPARFTIER